MTRLSNRIFSLTGILLVVVLVILYLPRCVRSQIPSDVSKIENWFYTDENGNNVDITLPDKLYQDNEGNIVIKTYLSEEFPAEQTLCFWTFYQSVEVYLDDELIYLYDNSNGGSFGEASSSQWNFVEMPDESPAGKLLTLKMHTPYSDINIRLNGVVYGKNSEVHQWLNRSYNIFRLLELLFIAVGVLMVVLVVFQKMNRKEKLYQLYSGLVFVVFSLYLRTGTKGLPIYWLSAYTKELCCFLCLLFLAVPFTLYIREKVSEQRKMVLWCDILIAIEIILGTVSFVLHGLGIIDMHRTMPVSCMVLLVSVITGMVYALYYLIKKKRKNAVPALVCLVIILICFFLEYIQFYQLSTLPFDTGLLSHLGALAVIIIETVTQIVFLGKEIKDRTSVESENQSLQLQLLTDQIRPHFLLNTVGAIRTLIHEDPDRASDLLYEFSKYFRKNFEQKDYTKPVPFPQELDYIATYLKLEKARFGDKLNVEYDIEEKAFWVLPLTIQPFVENAVKHGIFPANYDGTIKISTKKVNGGTLIEIRDNGVGFDAKTVNEKLEEKKSVGLRSAKFRLQKSFGAKVDIISSTKPGRSGTTVSIVIPEKRRTKNEDNNR